VNILCRYSSELIILVCVVRWLRISIGSDVILTMFLHVNPRPRSHFGHIYHFFNNSIHGDLNGPNCSNHYGCYWSQPNCYWSLPSFKNFKFTFILKAKQNHDSTALERHVKKHNEIAISLCIEGKGKNIKCRGDKYDTCNGIPLHSIQHNHTFIASFYRKKLHNRIVISLYNFFFCKKLYNGSMILLYTVQ